MATLQTLQLNHRPPPTCFRISSAFFAVLFRSVMSVITVSAISPRSYAESNWTPTSNCRFPVLTSAVIPVPFEIWHRRRSFSLKDGRRSVIGRLYFQSLVRRILAAANRRRCLQRHFRTIPNPLDLIRMLDFDNLFKVPETPLCVHAKSAKPVL